MISHEHKSLIVAEGRVGRITAKLIYLLVIFYSVVCSGRYCIRAALCYRNAFLYIIIDEEFKTQKYLIDNEKTEP